MNPTGGLPRRKTALEGLRTKGPLLLLDSGNALFALEGTVDDASKPRARFVLETMGQLGTKAMVAGARDLNAGAGFLKDTAAKAGVRVLSANLREKGARVFDGSAVLEVAGVKVAVIGLSPPGPISGSTTLTGEPLVAAAKAELLKVKGKAALTVVLAAVRTVDAFELAAQLKGQVDLYLLSSEPRGATVPQRIDGSWLLNGGQRGQGLGQVVVKTDGAGPLIDLTEIERQKETLAALDGKLKEIKARFAAATDAETKALVKKTVAELEARRAEQKKLVDVGVAKGARTFEATWISLDASVVDEPALKAQVLKIEPTYAGKH